VARSKTPPAEGSQPPRSQARTIVALLVVGYAVLFLVLNRDSVNVHFVFFSTRVPLFWALALAVLVGAGVGWLAARRRAGRG
jgi:uncharacterized integral membrane protein